LPYFKRVRDDVGRATVKVLSVSRFDGERLNSVTAHFVHCIQLFVKLVSFIFDLLTTVPLVAVKLCKKMTFL